MLRVLDLFCGGGGASMGMFCCGAQVTGVDLHSQKYYPFAFVQANVLDLSIDFLREFVFIWASPPCQAYSVATPKAYRDRHPRIIDDVRGMLIASGVPFCIENVPRAPLRKDLLLCGEMFGLRVIRHRIFEMHGFSCNKLSHRAHRGLTRMEAYKRGVKNWYYTTPAGHGCGVNELSEWQKAMRINWVHRKKTLAQCIPPAYSQYIFEQFLSCREYAVQMEFDFAC